MTQAGSGGLRVGLRRGLAAVLVLAALGAGAVAIRSWPRWFPDRLQPAQAAYDRGDWRAAARAARAVLKDRPDDPAALHLLARATARSGQDDTAQALYERLGPDAMEGEDFLMVAQALLRRDQVEPALGVLEHSRRALPTTRPDAGGVRHELARLQARLGRLGPARKVAGELAGVPGWEARGSLILGLIDLERHEPAHAITALERALRYDPALREAAAEPAAVRRALGRAWLQVGQPARARAEIEAAIAGRDPDPETAWLLSRAWLQEGRVDRAETALEGARTFAGADPLRPEPATHAGAAACAECHAEIHRAQQSSRHARTLVRSDALARLDLPRLPAADPARPDVTHALERRNGRLGARAQVDDATYRAVVEYALGSGDRGQSYVARDEAGTPRVLRLSLYENASLWDLTARVEPRPADPREYLGRALDAESLTSCLECHMTSEHAARDATAPEAADRGIGCERCHGPGGNHLRAVALGFPDPAIARPRLADAAGITTLCAHCHGGDDTSIRPEDPRFVRFQSRTLVLSPCYTRSAGGLSCVTCHDPHHDAETSPSAYEAKCLGCHGPGTEPAAGPDTPRMARTRPAVLPPGEPRTVCPINATSGCVKCHMPPDHQAAPHTTFTDHNIRVHAPPSDPAG